MLPRRPGERSGLLSFIHLFPPSPAGSCSAPPHPGLGREVKAEARADGDRGQDEVSRAPAAPRGLVPLCPPKPGQGDRRPPWATSENTGVIYVIHQRRKLFPSPPLLIGTGKKCGAQHDATRRRGAAKRFYVTTHTPNIAVATRHDRVPSTTKRLRNKKKNPGRDSGSPWRQLRQPNRSVSFTTKDQRDRQ